VRHADFVARVLQGFGSASSRGKRIEQHVEDFIRGKKPGAEDAPELQAIRAIRRTEARRQRDIPVWHVKPGDYSWICAVFETRPGTKKR